MLGIVCLLLVVLMPASAFGQQQLNGRILDGGSTTEASPMEGANVFWLNSSIGTITDFDGEFSIPYEEAYNQLVISYIGYRTDTLTVLQNRRIEHTLNPSTELTEIEITAKRKASKRSTIDAQNVILVSSDELLKAACCNLSESFETNPSIDVNFADAISGARQIKMLGLRSPYILITTENIPAIRGAAQTYGLSFIPGTWVESIQITKGAGSVVNGFESIAGQINTELQKPTTDDRIFVNAYGAVDGRYELNTHLNTKIGERWATGLYVHGNLRSEKFDNNNDGFLDVPLAEQINVMNRWQYTNPEKGLVSFFNIRYMNDEKQTGQLSFDPATDKFTTNAWGSEINTQRFEAATKVGWVNPDIPYQSMGVQAAFSNHQQESYFGNTSYDITHNSFYSTVIYNSIISDSRHKIKTGMSFTYDSYDEMVNLGEFTRKENSVGGFFEYAFDNLDKLNLTAGVRVDNHNIMGFFVTPRLHVRQGLWDKASLRFSAGSGQRMANIFTENQSMFASNRIIRIEAPEGKVANLNPEKAWNYGVSFLQGFEMFGQKGDFILDYYRTEFVDQVVVDWGNPRTIRFYNLEGKSYANSFQAELNYEPLESLEIRLAYKNYDVQTQFVNPDGEVDQRERPMTPRNRFFANAGYETNKKDSGSQWKFDVTYNWLDTQSFPSTEINSPQFQLPDRSPTVGTLSAQVTKVFSPNFELYLGGENITNVQQNNPILAADDPFGVNFDTTFVYGPIFGSLYYAGLRYKLN
ncbi:MAG: TonB-dependent receptor [Flavobacteriaceae bacterium]|nr:TonB-dependent receptor [Flavobacteriaceae bacterium]